MLATVLPLAIGENVDVKLIAKGYAVGQIIAPRIMTLKNDRGAKLAMSLSKRLATRREFSGGPRYRQQTVASAMS
jgi:hypothetical protein